MLRAPEGRAVMRIAGVLATLATSSTLVGSDWPDGPNKDFFQKLQRPDIWEPWDGDSNSYPDRSCCGPGEVVKTQFRVVPADATHPLDAWFAWLKNNWVQIPPAKIVPEYAPDGKAYLFVMGVGRASGVWSTEMHDEILCFVRPKGGL